MITLYKTYVLPNFEYCSPLRLGISRTLNNKLERANHYALRSILNLLGSSVTHDACLSIASMTSLEQRHIERSLIVFFQSFRLHGPNYISNFLKPGLPTITYEVVDKTSLNHLIIIVLCIILFLSLLPMCGIICLCLLNQLPRSSILNH